MASVSNATSFGLKTQSNTTSKISHALEVLKKFDNKYKIKPSGVRNTPKFIDVINTSTDISDKSKQDKPQEGVSHMYTPESAQIGLVPVALYAGNTSTSTRPSVDKHNIKIKSPDRTRPRTYNGIRNPDSIPEVITVTGLDEGEDYESDFELSDSESLNVESDASKEIYSIGKSKPGSRLRSNLHSSETESSIHTIPDQDDSKSIENVGVFGNMRLFTFSDLDSKAVNKIDELIVPVKLKDSTTLIGKPDAGAIKKVNTVSNNNFERNLEIQIPLNVGFGEKGANSSDYESIPESLSNSSVSDDSCIPIRRNIFMMDDLNGADLDQPIQVALPSHIKVGTQETQNVAILGGILFTLEEDIEEVIEDDSDNKAEQHILTDGSILSDPKFESDYLSESDINPKQESSGKSWKSNSSLKSTSNNRPVHKLNQYVPITHLLEDPHTKTNDRKHHLMTRNVSVQTELLEKGRHSPRVRSTQTQLVFEPLNLSWDFDKEEDNRKSARPFILHHQILTPEVVEALATQKPAEDALDQVIKQQISLTKHFMASQYKMYQTYCMSVRQLTNQYTPITLEETKEFIKMNKKMRANRNDQHVFT